MKKRFFVFLFFIIISFLFSESQLINLKVVSSGVHDIATDLNGTVHIVWSESGHLMYGQIYKGKIINKESIPGSSDYKVNFIRPRLSVRPDGKSIHLSWMNAKPGTKLIHVWKDSSGWHREVVWEKKDNYYVSVPFAVCDLTGTVHVIAQLWKLIGTNVYSKITYWHRKRYSSEWNSGYTLWEGQKKWRDTSMFVDQKGGIHAVFKSGSDPGKYIYAKNGELLSNSKIEDIPIAPGKGARCVSFGDLFVTEKGEVHHAFMTYPRETIDYAMKPSLTSRFTNYSQPSKGGIHICNEEAYPNPWPSIAVAPWEEIYVTWAEMPCPNKRANKIILAIKPIDSEIWIKKVLTNSANIHKDSKPAITANDDGVFIVFRNNKNELMLYAIGEGTYINSPPIAKLKFSPEEGLYPLKVSFDATESYDPDGYISKYELNFGDGTKSDKEKITHTYKQPGTYIVALKVTDNDGDSDIARGSVNVYNVQPPLNQSFVLGMNRSLFAKEYYYKITWSSNPFNSYINAVIVQYRIFRAEETSEKWTYLDSVPASKFIYYDRTLGDKKKKYKYKVKAVDSEGRISD